MTALVSNRHCPPFSRSKDLAAPAPKAVNSPISKPTTTPGSSCALFSQAKRAVSSSEILYRQGSSVITARHTLDVSEIQDGPSMRITRESKRRGPRR